MKSLNECNPLGESMSESENESQDESENEKQNNESLVAEERVRGTSEQLYLLLCLWCNLLFF